MYRRRPRGRDSTAEIATSTCAEYHPSTSVTEYGIVLHYLWRNNALNLIDRIKIAGRALADSKPKPKTDAEIGVAGDFTAAYRKEESRLDDIKIADYRNML